jgi:hypothetical protein
MLKDGKSSGPVAIAVAIAIISVLGLLLIDHGPWSKPKVHNPAQLATDAAVKAAGATVTPTQPPSPLEPTPAGPKPVNPAIPATR